MGRASGPGHRRHRALQVEALLRVDAAGVAALVEAVVRPDLGARALRLVDQELLRRAGVEVVPRQRLCVGDRPRRELRRVEAAVGEGALPELGAEVLAPLIESRAELVGTQERATDAAVPMASRKNSPIPPQTLKLTQVAVSKFVSTQAFAAASTTKNRPQAVLPPNRSPAPNG